MAITAKFTSDFTDFDKGVKGAQKALKDLELTAEQTGGRLMDVKGYRDSSVAAGTLSDELRKFDSILRTGGVSLGPFIGAVAELGAAAKIAAPAMTALLGPVGLVIGTFLTAKAATEAILGFIGIMEPLTQWIANLAKAAGYADPAIASLAAKNEVLAKATENAKRPITDYAEAIRINAKAAEDMALAFGRSANPIRESNIELSRWQREIRELRKRGDYEALTADLDMNAHSVEELSKKYGIHTDALEYLKRKIAETAAEETKAAQTSAAANAKRVADMEATAKAEEAFRQVRWKQQLELDTKIVESTNRQAAASLALTNNAVVKELEATLKLTAGVAAEETAFTRLEAAQRSLQAAKVAGFPTIAQETVLMDTFGKELMEAAIAEEKLRFAAQGVKDETAKVPEAVKPANDSVITLGQAAQQTAGSFWQMSAGLYEAIRAAQQWDALAGMDKNIYGSTIGGIGGSSASTRYMGAAVSQRGVTVNINGSVLGNKDEIARVVGTAVTSAYRSGGNRLPV